MCDLIEPTKLHLFFIVDSTRKMINYFYHQGYRTYLNYFREIFYNAHVLS